MIAGQDTLAPRTISEVDYRRLCPKLLATFRRVGASEEEARELTQETFLQAWKSRESFDCRAQFDTWVVSIAKRVWLSRLRTAATLKRAVAERSLDPLSDQGKAAPDFESVLLDQDLLHRVARSVDRLPKEMKGALVLYVRGTKYREIADRLKISENRVSSLILQARTKLRKEFSRG